MSKIQIIWQSMQFAKPTSPRNQEGKEISQDCSWEQWDYIKGQEIYHPYCEIYEVVESSPQGSSGKLNTQDL